MQVEVEEQFVTYHMLRSCCYIGLPTEKFDVQGAVNIKLKQVIKLL